MDKNFIFFTLNDFLLTDGGTIRMNGIVGSLSDMGNKVTLISNTPCTKDNDSDNVNHIHLAINNSKSYRRKYLFLLSILPFFIFRLIYRKDLNRIIRTFEENNIEGCEVIFFEYIDNAIGYSLIKSGVKINAVFDVHGVADLEFLHKESANIKSFIVNKVKFFLTRILDFKVFSKASKVIALNEVFKQYLIDKYSYLDSSMFYIVDDGLTKELREQEVNIKLRESLIDLLSITPQTTVVFFAGYFKSLGGVPDLVEAFHALMPFEDDAILVLVGDGEDYPYVSNYIQTHGLESRIHLMGRCDYSNLKTYQSIGDVLVCPDRKHPYSDLIVHTKYYEALYTGKVVINGAFNSVLQINHDETLSLLFKPSSISDLSKQILFAIKNINELTMKYSGNKTSIPNIFSYSNAVLGFFK
jgi:glycosyltransferase involved in cell wall biosynthesis